MSHELTPGQASEPGLADCRVHSHEGRVNGGSNYDSLKVVSAMAWVRTQADCWCPEPGPRGHELTPGQASEPGLAGCWVHSHQGRVNGGSNYDSLKVVSAMAWVRTQADCWCPNDKSQGLGAMS